MNFLELLEQESCLIKEHAGLSSRQHEQIQNILADYAMGKTTAQKSKAELKRIGYTIDHRNDWVNNTAYVTHISTGKTIKIEV